MDIVNKKFSSLTLRTNALRILKGRTSSDCRMLQRDVRLRAYHLLDEIQNVEGWEHFARRLADEKRRVFITGSNAHMLSREIASTLGGRYLMQEIYPFSFTEYLEYNHITLDTHWHLAPIRTDVVRLFEGYFYNGGLPESFSYTDKRAWLTSLYQKYSIRTLS